MEQLVLLVVIGLISLINWVMQQAAERREAAKTKRVESRELKRETRRNVYTQPAPAPTVRRAAAERDPFKDLMDALGLPAEGVPPRPVVARPDDFEEEEFSSLEAPAPPALPERVVTKPRGKAASWHPPARRAQPDEKTKQLASAFAALEDASPETWRGGNVRSLLANSSSQRKAVILSEILGTPRGLARPDALMTRGHL
jgi:cytoskeletal protein RodZ